MPLLNSDHQSGLRLGLWPSPIFMIAEAPALSGDASPDSAGAAVPVDFQLSSGRLWTNFP